MEPKIFMPWNKYAQSYPLVVFCSCIFLFFLNLSRQNWMYLVPVAVLGINSASTFVFWTLRLRVLRRDRRRSLLAVGYIAQMMGVLGFGTLLTVPAIVLVAPHWLARFNDGLSVVFWLMWGFALVELVHSHLYKLTYGRYTLEHVVVQHRWNEWEKPLGGAIGQQIQKIRRDWA